MTPKPAGPYACPRCDRAHPRGCHGHVEECTACRWRGDALVGRPCAKCGGEVLQRPCKAPPLRGGNVCRMHGGHAAQVLAASGARLDEAEAYAAVAKIEALIGEIDADAGTDALEILVQRLAREARMAGVADMLIDQLAIVPNACDEEGNPVEGLYGPDHNGDLKPHPLVAIGQRFSDDAARHAKLALDAGVAERQLELDIKLGRWVANAISATFDAMAATAEQRLAARPVLEQLLRTGVVDVAEVETG